MDYDTRLKVARFWAEHAFTHKLGWMRANEKHPRPPVYRSLKIGEIEHLIMLALTAYDRHLGRFEEKGTP